MCSSVRISAASKRFGIWPGICGCKRVKCAMQLAVSSRQQSHHTLPPSAERTLICTQAARMNTIAICAVCRSWILYVSAKTASSSPTLPMCIAQSCAKLKASSLQSHATGITTGLDVLSSATCTSNARRSSKSTTRKPMQQPCRHGRDHAIISSRRGDTVVSASMAPTAHV